MTPQKVVIKIPRKQGEMIPFDIDTWNTGEYEAIDKEDGIGRVLCTDNGGIYPIIVAYGNSLLCSFTTDGRYTVTEKEPSLFLRKKSSEELPIDAFMNIYNSGLSLKYDNLVNANKNATNNRLAIIHITYQWEDEK